MIAAVELLCFSFFFFPEPLSSCAGLMHCALTIKWQSDERERWRARENIAVWLWDYWFTGPEVVHTVVQQMPACASWSSTSLPKEMPVHVSDVSIVRADESIWMCVRAFVLRLWGMSDCCDSKIQVICLWSNLNQSAMLWRHSMESIVGTWSQICLSPLNATTINSF